MKTAFRVRTIDNFVDLQNLFPDVQFKYPMTFEQLEIGIFGEHKDGAVFYLEDDNTWKCTDL